MRLGIAIGDDTWHFFNDIHQYLSSCFDVSVFKFRPVATRFMSGSINRMRFHRSMESFLASQDVVFFEWAGDMLAAATQMPKRCRIVTRLHRYEMFEYVAKIDWDAVDRVILVSEAMERKLIAQCPNCQGKTVVIPEAVLVEQFLPLDKPFGGDIGTMCHLTPRKRVYELIISFAEFLRRGFDARLHIGGDPHPLYGDYYDAMTRLVRSLGLEDRVTFYGEVRDAASWYRNIDVFVSNSYSEGLQVSPMEAMASGRYTISHWWDGADELLPETHLFYTESELLMLLGSFFDASEPVRLEHQERMRALACEKFDTRMVSRRIRAVIE